MRAFLSKVALCAGAALFALVPPALATDKINVGSAHKGFWDMTLIAFGQEAGIFKKHDIDLNIFWTDGGADTDQAIISGSIDLAVGTGTMGALSAYAKGAPIELLAATMTGASDLFWYVKGDTSIKSLKSPEIKTLAYSRPGSATHLIAEALVHGLSGDIKLIAAGGPSATLTQVMSGQIDVGWAAVPFGIDRTESGELRIIASGNDAPRVKNQSIRVTIANRRFVENNPDVVKRFMAAYKETIEWAYTSDDALKMWAALLKIDLELARRARAYGYPREALQLFPIRDIKDSVNDAVQFGRLKKALTDKEIKQLLLTSLKLEQELKR